MKALISPGEIIDGKFRVVALSNEPFDVAPPMFWEDCSNSVTERHTFHGGSFYAPVAAPQGEIVQPSIPESVSALAGLLAIDAAGLAEQYEAWANDPARTFAQRAFIAKAMTWRRDDPTLIAAAASLGLSDAQVDGLFVAALAL